MIQVRTIPTFAALRPGRRVLVGVAALGALSAVVVPAAVAATSTSSPVYYACATKSSGALRQVSAAKACKSTETRISWNQQGVPGATGATGATGASGAPGVSGYQVVTGTDAVPGLNAAELRAYCPDGEQVLGGGYTTDVNVENASQVSLVGAEPMHGTAAGDYYTVTLANFQVPPAAGSTLNVTVTATCAQTTTSAGSAAAAHGVAPAARPAVLHVRHLTAAH